jgi:hypothetical protein
MLEGDAASAYASRLGQGLSVERLEDGTIRFGRNSVESEQMVVFVTKDGEMFTGDSVESLPEEIQRLLEANGQETVQITREPGDSQVAVNVDNGGFSVFTEDGVIFIDAEDTEALEQFGIRVNP